jgi:hypothetical protein
MRSKLNGPPGKLEQLPPEKQRVGFGNRGAFELDHGDRGVEGVWDRDEHVSVERVCAEASGGGVVGGREEMNGAVGADTAGVGSSGVVLESVG